VLARGRAGRGRAAGLWSLFAVLAAVYVYLAVRLPGGPDGMSDLHVYLGGVRALLQGGTPYDFVSFNGDQFVYPPFAGVALVPLLVLSEPVLRVVWTVGQCAEVAVLAWMLAVRASHPVVTRASRALAVPALACVLLVSTPVFTGLFLGQVSLLITVLALLDALDLTPRRLRGIPLGLAAAVKLTPLAFVPYLWLTGRRRAAGVAVGTFVLASALAWLVAPVSSRTFWGTVLTAPAFVNLAQFDNASLQGLLARLEVVGPVRAAVLVVGGGLVALLAYRRSRRLYASGELLAGAVVVGAMAVLVSPVSWSHHQTTLVLAGLCLVSSRSTGANRLWVAVVFALMFLPLQLVGHRWWPAADVVTDNLVVLLAVLVACVVPFRTATVEPQRREPGDVSTRPARVGAGLLARRS
jgi:alpha-1,2-mannosyltransferase